VTCTERDFENYRGVGIQLEDQVIPKKCGPTEEKLLVSKGEMV
jgi:2-methylisocitrate lyase-like PEP mutase family enzyme